MSLSVFLDRIVGILEDQHVGYMVTDSLAAACHGAPRATQDVDVVIEVTESRVSTLASAFGAAGYYVSEEAAKRAVTSRGQFNVIDARTGWKADLIVRKDRPFSRSEFERRRPMTVTGRDLFMVSAEDLVIAKLEWARLGESDRQLRDVAGILDVQGDDLDREYMLRWIKALELDDLWSSLVGNQG